MSELAADPFLQVAQSDAVANDSVGPYYLADRKLRIAIARVGDRLYAFDDLCTCSDEQCPLSGGLLRETSLMCQCHGSWFDIKTGAVISGPARKALNVYDVQEVSGDIRVRAAAARGRTTDQPTPPPNGSLIHAIAGLLILAGLTTFAFQRLRRRRRS